MGIFYTGKGDGGISSVWDNKKLDKISPGLVALGDLDELNSLLGLVRGQKLSIADKQIIFKVQENLFIIQANIYLLLIGRTEKTPAFKEDKVKNIEKIIDALEKLVNPKRAFIIPGGESAASWLDFARSVSRRTERSVLILNKQTKIPAPILAYLNRLSSLLFALARTASKKKKIKEKNPSYK